MKKKLNDSQFAFVEDKDFDSFLKLTASSYKDIKYSDYASKRAKLPLEYKEDTIPFIANKNYLNVQIVSDVLVKYGIRRIWNEIHDISLDKKIKLYKIAKNSGMRITPRTDSGNIYTQNVVYEHITMRLLPETYYEVEELARSLNVSNQEIMFKAISISISESKSLCRYKDYVRNIVEPFVRDKIHKWLKMKNNDMLTLFLESMSKDYYKTYLMLVYEKQPGTGIEIEIKKYVLGQFRMYKILSKTIPDNPLYNEVTEIIEKEKAFIGILKRLMSSSSLTKETLSEIRTSVRYIKDENEHHGFVTK
ncbi:MAG: hypothetical protein Q7J82_01645, partial [Coriobacteriia bacterium]|nr:hypothetical protein [Coriobacteriia bacterium]